MMEFRRFPVVQRPLAKIPLPPQVQELCSLAEEEEEMHRMAAAVNAMTATTTEEIDHNNSKPFLDIAQFFLDDEDTSVEGGEHLVSQVIDLKRAVEAAAATGGRIFRPIVPPGQGVQVQDLYLFDESRTFVPILEDDEDELRAETEGCPSMFVGEQASMPQEEAELLFLDQASKEEFVLPLNMEGFPQGDDLLLAGEGDLFIEEANFFRDAELDERERETPSPATVDTEREDECEEGEDKIKTEDRAARTISPLLLHETSVKCETKEVPCVAPSSPMSAPGSPTAVRRQKSAEDKQAASPKAAKSAEARARKRSLACVSGSKAEQKRTKRKRKTPEQLAVLEKEFDANPMPNKEVRDQLSTRLGLTSRQVQIWFQNKRAKVKNSGGGGGASSSPTSPHQSPATSRAASPLLMLAPQSQQQQQGKTNGMAPIRLIPPNFTPENFAAAAAAAGHPHPIPLPPHAFLDLLSSGRGVNHLIASFAGLTPQQQQQALADMPTLIASAHIAPAPTLTPIAPAPAPQMHSPVDAHHNEFKPVNLSTVPTAV